MKKFLAACALALLASCGEAPAADGYTFEQEEFFRPAQPIEIVAYDSVADLRRAASKLVKLDDGRELMAFGLIHPDKCVIHMVKPSADYQPEWIGHELTHCVYGRWHGTQHTPA